MDYDRIGLKPDQREIHSPPVTHEIVVVEEHHANSPSILRMNYVRISKLSEPDTRSREDMAQTPNSESGRGPKKLGNIPEPELLNSEASQPLGLGLGQDSNSKPPTHRDLINPSHIRQEPQETVHHYWASFLLLINRVKDCREADAISLFCKNCMDKGILNAISAVK